MVVDLVSFTLIITFIAMCEDIWHLEVMDYLNLGFFFVVIIKSAELFIYKSALYGIALLLIFLSFFVGLFLVLGGLWGGGDAKYFISLPAYLFILLVEHSFSLTVSNALWGTLLLSFFYFALSSAILYCLLIGVIWVTYAKKVVLKRKIVWFGSWGDTFFIFISVFVVIAFVLFPSLELLTLMVISHLLMVLVAKKGLSEEIFVREKLVNHLSIGDWLKDDIYRGKKLIVKKQGAGISEKDIEILKKYKINSVCIQQGLPMFVGFFVSHIIFLYFIDTFIIFSNSFILG